MMSFSAVQPTHSRLFALSSLVLLLLAFFSFPSEAQGQNQAKELAQAQGQERAQAQGRSQVQRSTRQAAPGRAPRLLTVEQYSRLTSEQRQNYIGALQDLYIKVESQQMHRGRPMRYSAVDQNGEFHSDAGVNGAWPVGSEMFTSFWAQVLGASAWAEDSSSQCVIGGVIRPLIGGRCPTHNRACSLGDEEDANTFKCGLIFKEVCVPRTVDGQIGSITQRCKEAFDALEDKGVSPEDYEEISGVYDRLLDQALANTSPDAQGIVLARYNLLKSELGSQSPEGANSPGGSSSPSGAAGFVDPCPESVKEISFPPGANSPFRRITHFPSGIEVVYPDNSISRFRCDPRGGVWVSEHRPPRQGHLSHSVCAPGVTRCARELFPGGPMVTAQNAARPQDRPSLTLAHRDKKVELECNIRPLPTRIHPPQYIGSSQVRYLQDDRLIGQSTAQTTNVSCFINPSSCRTPKAQAAFVTDRSSGPHLRVDCPRPPTNRQPLPISPGRAIQL